MSIIATYARVDAGGLERLQDDPDWITTLEQKRIPNVDLIDVDKACDGIVWLLSRVPAASVSTITGAGFVLQANYPRMLTGEGGTKERSLESSYGEAISLDPVRVQALSKWLDAIDIEQMRSRYDPKAMAKESVYPQIWIDEGMGALDEYLIPHVTRLRDFVKSAAAASQFVLVFYT